MLNDVTYIPKLRKNSIPICMKVRNSVLVLMISKRAACNIYIFFRSNVVGDVAPI